MARESRGHDEYGVRGGVLACEMGLGKTVETLGLIVSHPGGREPESADGGPLTLATHPLRAGRLARSAATAGSSCGACGRRLTANEPVHAAADGWSCCQWCFLPQHPALEQTAEALAASSSFASASTSSSTAASSSSASSSSAAAPSSSSAVTAPPPKRVRFAMPGDALPSKAARIADGTVSSSASKKTAGAAVSSQAFQQRDGASAGKAWLARGKGSPASATERAAARRAAMDDSLGIIADAAHDAASHRTGFKIRIKRPLDAPAAAASISTVGTAPLLSPTLAACGCTLVVTPASILRQWLQEIERHGESPRRATGAPPSGRMAWA